MSRLGDQSEAITALAEVTSDDTAQHVIRMRDALIVARSLLGRAKVDVACSEDGLRSARLSLVAAQDAEMRLDEALGATKAELEASREEVGATKTELEIAKAKLEMSLAELELTQTKLETSLMELETSNTLLEHIKTELEATKTESGATKTQLETELGATKTQLETTTTELETTTTELQTTKTQERELQVANVGLLQLKGQLMVTKDELREYQRLLEEMTNTAKIAEAKNGVLTSKGDKCVVQ